MTDTGREPGVPFPMKIFEDVLCRDCPFPAKEGWPADVNPSFEEWRKQALNLTASKLDKIKLPDTANTGSVDYSGLVGKTLEVVHPGGGARMILNPNRVILTVDEASTITNVTVGR